MTDPLAAAADLRARAADAYERAAACPAALGPRDHALLRMNTWAFIDASGGGHDLALAYAPLLQPGRPPREADFDAADGFLEKLRPAGQEAERWLVSLKAEAAAYLARLRGDRLLRQAEQRADRGVRALLVGVDRLPPDDLRRMRAYVMALRAYRGLALPWRIEPLYRRFLARFPAPHPVDDLIQRLETDFASVPSELFEAWGYLADAVVPALEMRNPADTRELDALRRVQTPLEAVIDGRPDEDVIAVAGVTRAEFRRSGRSLRAILRAVAEGSRPAHVLAAWQGLAYLGLGDYRGLFALLERVPPDDAALGIVVRSLRGEARYRLGQYEDAYLDLLAAERLAQAEACATTSVAQASPPTAVGACSSATTSVAQASPPTAVGACSSATTSVAQASPPTAVGACSSATTPVAQALACSSATTPVAQALACGSATTSVAQASPPTAVGACGSATTPVAQALACGSANPAERDALSRLAQKAGNALLAIGDEAKADAAFARAASYLPADPVARATDLINRGNLALLRNALDRDQGYMTVDRVLRKRLVEEGPAVLDAERGRRHAESLDAAEAAYRAALEILGDDETPDRFAKPVRRELAALCHLNLGNLAWARAKDASGRDPLLAAEKEYVAALALLDRRATQHGLAAILHVNLSEVRYLLGDLDRALRDLTGFENPSGLRAIHPDLPWQAQYNLARIRQARDEPDAAAACYRAAIDLIEAQRAGVRSDAWQASFLRDKTEVYEGYLDFLYEHGGDEKVAAMFAVIERLRGHAFLDLLARAQVRAAVPDALRAEADALLAKISAANEALRAATLADDEAAAARRVRQQAEYARQWADVQAQILASQQSDAQLNPPRITLADAQARLRPDAPRPVRSDDDATLLIYQLGEAASYLLVVTPDAATVHRLPPRRAIELLAQAVIFDCSFGDANAAPRFRQNAIALSRALLGPLDARPGKRLLIAPDGGLRYLPFEALFPDPDAVPEAATYAELAGHYLLDRADVTYIPSASAWRELSDRPRAAPASSLLAVYDVHYDTGDPPLWAYPILMKLDSVPGAADVRKAVAFCQQAWPELPVSQLRARRDDDSPEDADHQPTEPNFLRVAPLAAARYVVFNGHATYNDKHPSLSGLIFNLSKPADPDAADIPADNFLRVDELFRLELPAAELTLLAACQTALGAPYRGEGLNALLRAFMYRGSPAVVATLWAVDAAAASWLVRRFFKLLAENPDADPARLFNRAKRAAITFDRQWQPFHWAAFIYAGR